MPKYPYQLFPPLTPERYGSWKESIQEVGVLVRIVCDEAGNIIDEFHRQQICDELGIHCPREIKRFETDAEKFEFALRANCERRQLNKTQREQLVEANIKCDPEMCSNAMASITGVSDKTISKIRLRLESTSEIPKLDKLRGLDGKLRRQRYTTIIADTPKQTETALQVINDLPNSCQGKTLDITTAKRRAARKRNLELREERERTVKPLRDDDIKLFHCRFPTPSNAVWDEGDKNRIVNPMSAPYPPPYNPGPSVEPDVDGDGDG